MGLLDRIRSRFAAGPSASGGLGSELAVANPRLQPSIFVGGLAPYNPDEIVGRKGLRVWDDMLLDEQVHACLSLKTQAVVGPGWRLEPASDAPGDVELADQLTLDLLDMPGTFADSLDATLLGALGYGYSIAEKVYQLPDLAIGAIKDRSPHGFYFDADVFGNLRALQQEAGLAVTAATPMGRRVLPPEKFVVFTHQGRWGNWYGRSDLRTAHRAWWHKQTWHQLWMTFGEKLADPPIVAKYPKGESETLIQTIHGMLQRLAGKSVVTLFEGWEIDVLEASKAPDEIFVGTIDRLDTAIAKGILVPDKLGLSGGPVAGGSYSLAQTQLGAFFFVLDRLKSRIEDAYNEQLIAEMAALRAPAAKAPRLALLPMSQDNREAVATLWGTLTQQGAVISDVKDENHVRRLLDFPEVEEQEEELRAAVLARKRDMATVLTDRLQSHQTDPNADPNADPEDDPNADPEATPPAKGAKRTPPDPKAAARKAKAAKESLASDPAVDEVPLAFWRPLTALETRCDMAAKRDAFETLTPELAAVVATGTEQMAADIRAAAAKGVRDGLTGPMVSRLAAKAGTRAALRRGIREVLASAYAVGRKGAIAELRGAKAAMAATGRGTRSVEGVLDRMAAGEPGIVGAEAERFFTAKAFYVTGVVENAILSKAKLTLLAALRQEKTARQITFELDQDLAEWIPERDAAGRIVNVPHRIETIARTNLAESLNEGRFAAFTDPDLDGFVESFRYTAILDNRTRDEHRAWDGVVRKVNDPVWYGPPDRRPPNGYNCRCLLLPVTVIDAEPETETLPSEEIPDPGFK